MQKKAKEDGVEYRAGFVALLGRPNVGKSTLTNALLGEKVSIVTPKPQTTRTRIYGILNLDHAQIVLVDTPGVHTRKTPLNRALCKTASSAAMDSDITVVMVEAFRHSDGTVRISEEDRWVMQMAQKGDGICLLAINKIDVLPQKDLLLPLISQYAEMAQFDAIIPISARTGDGLDFLLEEITKRLQPGPALFPRDMHTDQAERVLCAEMVREQLLLQMQEEIPHSAMVVIETFEDERDSKDEGMCHLEGRIIVERDSQKAMVIGQGGQRIKSLSQAARLEIEKLLGCKVFLRLTVHVDKDWTTSERAVRSYGFGTSSGDGEDGQ